jgi:outer membrane protein assembly factor BamB
MQLRAGCSLFDANRFLMRTRALVLAAICVSQLSFSIVDRPLWRTPLTPGGSPPSGRPAYKNGRVFFIYAGIQAFSAKDGRVLWHVPVREFLPVALLASEDRVFVVERTVSALDSANGKQLWEFTPDADASLGVAALNRGNLYFGTSSHHVYAVNGSVGQLLWNMDLAPDWQYSGVVRGLALQDDGDTLYASVEQFEVSNGTKSSGWVFALRARDGVCLWKFKTGTGSQRQSATSVPVIAGNLILVSDALSNAVFAVDRHTGHLAWRFEGERGYAGSSQAPIVVGSTVFIISGDRYVSALNLESGLLFWRTQMPASNLAATTCGHSLLVNFEGLATLNPVTGAIQKVIFSEGDEFLSSAFIVEGDRVFVSGPKGAYAFACH